MNPRSNRQNGAALVVGLLLLLVLTLLAISGINSASLEFFMAGNEQFRQNAFQSAETGIEQAFANTALFNPNGALPAITGTNTATDAYTAKVTPQLGGQPSPVLDEASSATNFSTFYFEIVSTGTSTRSSSATNVQGARDTVNSSSVFPPIPGGPTKLSYP